MQTLGGVSTITPGSSSGQLSLMRVYPNMYQHGWAGSRCSWAEISHSWTESAQQCGSINKWMMLSTAAPERFFQAVNDLWMFNSGLSSVRKWARIGLCELEWASYWLTSPVGLYTDMNSCHPMCYFVQHYPWQNVWTHVCGMLNPVLCIPFTIDMNVIMFH